MTLGARQGELWEVVAGLKGDETLAASRLNELATGVAVEAENAESAAGGGNAGGGKSGKGGGKRGGKS